MSDSQTIRRGRGEPPIPLTPNSTIVRLPSCPDCLGRGYFFINPFATGSNGFGGPRNLSQCLTCLDAHAYWQEHGSLPPELETAS